MSNPEFLNDPTQTAWYRFATFVETHTTDIASLDGELKKATWDLNAPNQLIPIDRIDFIIFNESDPELLLPGADPSRKFIGHSIWMNIGEDPIYGIDLVEGVFNYNTADDRSGFTVIKNGGAVALRTIVALEEYERQGALTIATNY